VMLRPEISYSELESTERLTGEEAQFVLRLRANEDAAYDELVRAYNAPLFHVACRMLHDPGEAADVTQDIFVKVFKNIGKFRGECSLKTWIFKIGLREILNRIRWSRRRHRQSTIPLQGHASKETGETAPLQVPCEGLSPEAALERKERGEAIEKALWKLSPRYRSIVILRDIQGFSYSEISEVLGISMGTVKSRLARARTELKKCLMRYLSVQRIG
jgi:RNA polymerase sigma-70 factor (ECF subfamily)